MSRFEELNVGDVLVGQVTKVVPFGCSFASPTMPTACCMAKPSRR